MGAVTLVMGPHGSPEPPPRSLGGPSVSATTTRIASPPTTSRPPAAQAPPARIGAFLAESAPASISIPSIGLHSTSFVGLGVATDGSITVPGTAQEVGLYRNGPTPGQLGPAVLAAHVDSIQGPGVFYRLGRSNPETPSL